MKRAVAFGLMIGMVSVTGTQSVLAAESSVNAVVTAKEENVYANLNQDGSVSGVYVVNELDVDGEGVVADYGDYSSTKNLTSDTEVTNEDGMVRADASEGKFYYQGNLTSTDLPWNIDIVYYFDGEEISAEKLAGKSGSLKIKINVTENTNVDSSFLKTFCCRRPWHWIRNSAARLRRRVQQLPM